MNKLTDSQRAELLEVLTAAAADLEAARSWLSGDVTAERLDHVTRNVRVLTLRLELLDSCIVAMRAGSAALPAPTPELATREAGLLPTHRCRIATPKGMLYDALVRCVGGGTRFVVTHGEVALMSGLESLTKGDRVTVGPALGDVDANEAKRAAMRAGEHLAIDIEKLTKLTNIDEAREFYHDRGHGHAIAVSTTTDARPRRELVFVVSDAERFFGTAPAWYDDPEVAADAAAAAEAFDPHAEQADLPVEIDPPAARSSYTCLTCGHVTGLCASRPAYCPECGVRDSMERPSERACRLAAERADVRPDVADDEGGAA